MVMAPERLSRLQRRILTWLGAEAQCTRGTMVAEDLRFWHSTDEDRQQAKEVVARL
jgi:hypothetical protein